MGWPHFFDFWSFLEPRAFSIYPAVRVQIRRRSLRVAILSLALIPRMSATIGGVRRGTLKIEMEQKPGRAACNPPARPFRRSRHRALRRAGKLREARRRHQPYDQATRAGRPPDGGDHAGL